MAKSRLFKKTRLEKMAKRFMLNGYKQAAGRKIKK
tara:strand:+ start:114 stop:218 length:105 start_codon:yes stop_codon:yes gene_type:complete